MKNTLPKICYWCGIKLTDETNNREHVPPNGFFPKGYREKLLTVPSCQEHNNKFSLLDQRFQIYIKGLGTNLVAIDDFKDRVVRGLNREQNKFLVASLSEKSFYVDIDGEQRLVMEIDHGHSQTFIEKIIRNIFIILILDLLFVLLSYIITSIGAKKILSPISDIVEKGRLIDENNLHIKNSYATTYNLLIEFDLNRNTSKIVNNILNLDVTKLLNYK